MKALSYGLMFLLLSTTAFGMGSNDPKHERGEKFKKALDLTDEQLTQIQAIRKEQKSERSADREEFMAAKKSFKEAMANPKSTKEELSAKYEAFQKSRDKHQRARFQNMLKMREVLKPEQLEKFSEMENRRGGKNKFKRKQRE